MGQGDLIYAPAASSVPNPLPLPPTTNPSTPTTGINFGDQLIAGRPMPYWKDSNGQTWFVNEQPGFYQATLLFPRDSTTTMGNAYGQATVAQDSSTITTTTWAQTSKYTRNTKTVYTSAAAINRGAGLSFNTHAVTQSYSRGNAANSGGFFFYCRFGLDTYAAGNRLFVGLEACGTLSGFWTGDPSAQTQDYIGLGMDAADTTASLYTRNNTTTTKTAITGMPAAATAGAFFLDFYLYCKPNDTTIGYRVDDLVAGSTVVDTTIATTLPRNTVGMAPTVLMGSGTSAASCAISCAHLYAVGQQN